MEGLHIQLGVEFGKKKEKQMIISKSSCSFLRLCLIIVSFVAFQCNADANQASTLVVNAGSGRPIPNTLFGIAFEEINRAGTGGLWCELVSVEVARWSGGCGGR